MEAIPEGLFPVGIKRQMKIGAGRPGGRKRQAEIRERVVGSFEIGDGGESVVAVFDEEMIGTVDGNFGREDAKNVGGNSGDHSVIGIENPDTNAGKRFVSQGVENQTQGAAISVF